jgi:hypothetical protein
MRKQIQAYACPPTKQSNLRRMAHPTTRRSALLKVLFLRPKQFGFITSCCISLLNVIKIPNDFFSGPSNPTPVATIQSTSGFSHFAFPSSCPTDRGRLPFRSSSSGRSQISFLALSNSGCMHRKNT